ncbi:MAG: hypothetical protein SZ59_C0002G0165 [candidate division TM6 bacterium GW2011_GWF2_28_16]|nr:MAG: hypothetical protein SZ59_C0002G0165 [candidate division TM6 bacterium GW2011_GWF2_28_16]
MLKTKKAFTLVEVLISLLISSFIMFGMMQIYNNLQKFIDKTYDFTKFNKKVYLLFNILEKDLSSAFITNLKEKKEDEKKDTKKFNECFKTDIYLGETFRHNKQKFELFKSLSFMTTNAFVIYDEKKARCVRVGYFLEKNKDLSKAGKLVYNLYRKETENIKNIDFKKQEDATEKDKKNNIKVFCIAENIKEFAIEYKGVLDKRDPGQGSGMTKEKKQEIKEKKLETSFEWGKKEGTQEILPNFVKIIVSFWDDKLSSENCFEKLIPIFVFEELKEKESENKENKKEENKEGANVIGSGEIQAGQIQGPVVENKI